MYHKYIASISQAWLIIYAAMALVNVKLSWKKGLIFALIYGVGIWGIRLIYNYFPVPFGVHTFIATAVIIVLFKLIVGNISWMKSIVGAVCIVILLFVGDFVILLPIMNYLNISVQELTTTAAIYYSALAGNVMLIMGIILGKIKNIYF